MPRSPKRFDVAPGRGSVWRPRTKSDQLPDLERSSVAELVTAMAELGTVLGGGGVPGSWRCNAIGLPKGDCTQYHLADSRYCYYHQKVQDQTIQDFYATNSSGAPVEVSPRQSYPVYPLPKSGYILLEREMRGE